MAEILYELDDRRVVKIGQRFNASDNVLTIFAGYFSGDEVKIQRTDLYCEKEVFCMSHAEMDDLIAAYAVYKADQAEEAESEAKRLAELEQEAYQLANTCKAIQVEKREQSWTVDIPDFGWNSGRVYGADELLSTVVVAIDYCKPIQEAYKLAKEYWPFRILG